MKNRMGFIIKIDKERKGRELHTRYYLDLENITVEVPEF